MDDDPDEPSTTIAPSVEATTPDANGKAEAPVAAQPSSRVWRALGLRRGRTARGTRDLTTGSIPKNLLSLAWPIITSNTLRIVDQLADFVWAAWGFGIVALAGIGAAQQWSMLAMTGRMGLDTAVRAMVSRAVGAGDHALASHIALQGFTLSIAFSAVMGALGIVLTPLLLRVLGVDDAVIDQANSYLRIQFVAVSTTGLMMMGAAILQASGDSFSPLRVDLVTRVLHLVLSPFLIFGWGIPGFDGMGIAGAALSNALAGTVGFALLIRILFGGRSQMHLSFRGYFVDFRMIWRIVRLGTPAAVTSIERAMGHLVLFMFVAPFGTTTVAAYSIVRRTQTLINPGGMGMGHAAGILVGQNLGAGKPRRARLTVTWALGIIIGFNLVSGGLAIAFPRVFMLVFNPSPELMDIATVWLRILALSFILTGASMVFGNSFNTAGDTLVPMLVTLVTIWGVQQPLAYILPKYTDLGQYGVAWAAVIGSIARVGIYIPYFIWGPWLKKKVL